MESHANWRGPGCRYLDGKCESYVFKIFSEGKGYEQCKFSGERFIILYLCKFGRLLGVDHSTLSFDWNFLFRLLQFNLKFYLNFPIVVTIIYYHSNCSIII